MVPFENDEGSSESEMEWEEVIDASTTTGSAATSGQQPPFLQGGPSTASSTPIDSATPDAGSAGPAAKDDGGIEVTLKHGTLVSSSNRFLKGKGRGRPPGLTQQAALERAYRQELHKAHTGMLLISGHVRNGWLNDKTLQGRLMSKCPLSIQNKFHEYSKTTHPKATDRSRLFESAVKGLLAWWHGRFTIEDSRPYGNAPTLLTMLEAPHSLDTVDIATMQDLLSDLSPKDRCRLLMPFAEEEHLAQLEEAYPSPSKKKDKDKGRGSEGKKKPTKLPKAISTELGELIRNPQSLAKRAVTMHGSRDMSAQLFTSLCRALDIPARLVCSIPAIDYRSASKVKRDEATMDARTGGSGKKKRKRTTSVSDEYDDEDFEEVQIRNALPSNALKRAAATTGNTSDASTVSGRASAARVSNSLFAGRKGKGRSASLEIDDPGANAVPTFWTEVYNRSLQEWITLDVVRNRMRPKRGEMDNGRIFYVVAYEVDQYIKDVTPRYARSFAGRTLKMRIPTRRRDEPEWWMDTLKPWTRPFVLGREQREDEELIRSQETEPMPTVLEGFKNHPRYILERHVKREEVIPERTRQLGLFRGEPVYPRSAVIPVKSAETWMREGRRIKEGEQPLKNVKQRAVTINKRRAQELAEQDGFEGIMQGLYSRSQTELVIPPPIVNGVVPKNAYGNLDLFAPHMLPRGAVHLPFKTIRKVAKELGVDFAEAITGFEFHKRRAIPTVSGIVIAAENKELVLEAYYASETAAVEKELEKRKERCLKRWRKLIVGLRVRSRIQGEYKKNQKSSAQNDGKGTSRNGHDRVEEGAPQLHPLNEEDNAVSQLGAADPSAADLDLPATKNGFLHADSRHSTIPGAAFPPLPVPDLADLPPMPMPDPSGSSSIDLPPMPDPDPRDRLQDISADVQRKTGLGYPAPLDIVNPVRGPGQENSVQLDEFTLSAPEELAEGGIDVNESNDEQHEGGFIKDEDDHGEKEAQKAEEEARKLKVKLKVNGIKQKDYAGQPSSAAVISIEAQKVGEESASDSDDDLEMERVDEAEGNEEGDAADADGPSTTKGEDDDEDYSASASSAKSRKTRSSTRTTAQHPASDPANGATSPTSSTRRRSTRSSAAKVEASAATPTRSTRSSQGKGKPKQTPTRTRAAAAGANKDTVATSRPRRAAAAKSQTVIEIDDSDDAEE